jgi:hypothetical protein
MSSATHMKDVVRQTFELLRRHGLTLEDLIQVGDEDLKSTNPKRAEKARRVEQSWALMARLGVRFADLEQAAGPMPRQVGFSATWRGSLFRSH